MNNEKDTDLDLDLDEASEDSGKDAQKKAPGNKKAEKKGKPEKEDAAEKKDPKKLSRLAPVKMELAPGGYPATPHHPATNKEPAVAGKPGFFVNKHGIAFPQGFKFKGGHISSQGNVVLVKCPECGNRLGSSEAIKGLCDNRECNYDAAAALDEITEEDLE